MPTSTPLVAWVFALLAATAVRAGGAPAAGGGPMAGPVFNQDNTNFFFDHTAEEMSGALVDAYIDELADDGIRTFVSCVNAMRTNYPSRVWESDWQGYDPKGPDDQPILRFLAPAAVAPTRRRLDSARRLAELGINFHERALARCRARGMGAWVSVRMNDVHDCMLPDAPLLSGFFKAERAAGLLREPYRDTSWADRALDWERPEVREHYFALVREQLQRLDLDGIELDWMRFAYHFRPGHELEGGRVITAWMWRVRAECEVAAKRLGHPVRLGVRVPSRPETARRCGLDAVAWARMGLVDVVVAAPFWATAEFDLPMLEWKRLLGGTRAQIGGALEIRYQPVPDGPVSYMTPELTAGAAMAVLHGGADFVYLYNYHPGRSGLAMKWASTLAQDWGGGCYRATIRALRSEDSLDILARTHAVTYRDLRAPGEPADNALPAIGSKQDMPWPTGCAFRLATGPRPVARPALLTLEFASGSAPDQVRVFVNSVECRPRLPAATAAKVGGLISTYSVPDHILLDDAQVVEVQPRGNAAFTVVRVELAIAAKGPPSNL